MRNSLALFCKGAVIGLANIIPGVSGGTMALVLGIYDRLIAAASRLGVDTLREIRAIVAGPNRRKELSRAWAKYDAGFLTLLVCGAAIAVLAASSLLLWLLFHHPDPTYGFFFGLVAASIIVPWSMMRRRSWPELAAAIVAVILTVVVSTTMSGEEQVRKEKEQIALRKAAGGEHDDVARDDSIGRLSFLFGVGGISSSAMILPGVSGSFLLLLFGAFEDVLGALSPPFDFVVIGVFGAGAIIGLALFVKLLDFLLRRLHSQTMAFLAGLMIGSLWNLWPYQARVPIGDKVIGVAHFFPTAFTTSTVIPLLTTITGAAIVLAVHRYEKRGERSSSGSEAGQETAREVDRA